MPGREQQWDVVIAPDRPWWKLDLREIWAYRDLLVLLVRRDLLATQRLPFREIGLAIGLRAAERIEALAEATDFPIGRGWREAAAGLIPLADEIEAFWLRPEHQAAPTWAAHADISTAMLAVALVPDGYLDL